MSSVVADGDDSSPELITAQALVRKAMNWHLWPLKGATFLQTDGPGDEGAEGQPPFEPYVGMPPLPVG